MNPPEPVKGWIGCSLTGPDTLPGLRTPLLCVLILNALKSFGLFPRHYRGRVTELQFGMINLHLLAVPLVTEQQHRSIPTVFNSDGVEQSVLPFPGRSQPPIDPAGNGSRAAFPTEYRRLYSFCKRNCTTSKLQLPHSARGMGTSRFRLVCRKHNLYGPFFSQFRNPFLELLVFRRI